MWMSPLLHIIAALCEFSPLLAIMGPLGGAEGFGTSRSPPLRRGVPGAVSLCSRAVRGGLFLPASREAGLPGASLEGGSREAQSQDYS